MPVLSLTISLLSWHGWYITRQQCLVYTPTVFSGHAKTLKQESIGGAMMSLFRTDRYGQVRRCGFYALWIALVIMAGLASRSELFALPAFFAKYTGDEPL